MRLVRSDFLIGGVSLLCCFWLVGCVHTADVVNRVMEVPKIILGTSTKALEDARDQATAKIYHCLPNECFDAVLKIAKTKLLKVFIANKKKMHIILMGVPESIDTTEVGVFFSSVDAQKTKVEIVSLGPQAQSTVGKLIFTDLAVAFTEGP